MSSDIYENKFENIKSVSIGRFYGVQVRYRNVANEDVYVTQTSYLCGDEKAKEMRIRFFKDFCKYDIDRCYDFTKDKDFRFFMIKEKIRKIIKCYLLRRKIEKSINFY